jgi:hypothetical protein
MLAFLLRSKHHLPRSILDAAHCVERISQEIQNNLLKLNAVTADSRQMIIEFLFQNYIESL